MKSALIPKLRFQQFETPWREDVVEHHFEFKNGLNKEKEYFGKGIPIVNFTDVFHKPGLKREDIKGLVDLNQKEIERFSVAKGDVFFTRTSETIDEIGMSSVLLEEIPNCVFSGFVLRARPIKPTLVDEFKQYVFRTASVRKEITTKSSYTTRALTSGTLLNKVVLRFPESLSEQQKIASFLSAVDEKIRQLKRKKELLERYKKGVMQQIFERKIRFKDEKGKAFLEWEEKRLGEVGSTFNGLTGKNKDDFGSGKRFIQYKQIFDSSSIVLENCGLVKILEGENQQEARFGDVFFTTSSETPNEIGTSSVLLEHVSQVYLNSFCFGYRPNSINELIPLFSRYLFRSGKFRKGIVRLAQGSTRYNMSKSEFLKLNVELPCELEQQKIASFLSSLDKKIEFVSQQVEKAQEFKKGLLQQMFV